VRARAPTRTRTCCSQMRALCVYAHAVGESIRGCSKDTSVPNNYEREFHQLCALLSVVCALMNKQTRMDMCQLLTVCEYMNHAARRIERVKVCLRDGYARLRQLAAADVELQMRIDSFETYTNNTNYQNMRKMRNEMSCKRMHTRPPLRMPVEITRHGNWIKPKQLISLLTDCRFTKAKVLVVYVVPDVAKKSQLSELKIYIPELLSMQQRQTTVIIPHAHLM
jgi:hypothetical protein